MKKVVAILLAGVLVLGGAVTAFAAGSQTGTAVAPTISSESGITSSQQYTTAQKAAVDALVADTTNSTLADVEGITADAAAAMTLRYYFNVSGASSSPVTFSVVGAIPGKSTVYVLQYNESTGKWEKVEATISAEGKVTVQSLSSAPTVIYLDTESAKEADAKTSPDTGEAPVTAAAAMIALCAVAGLAVSSKRRHA